MKKIINILMRKKTVDLRKWYFTKTMIIGLSKFGIKICWKDLFMKITKVYKDYWRNSQFYYYFSTFLLLFYTADNSKWITYNMFNSKKYFNLITYHIWILTFYYSLAYRVSKLAINHCKMLSKIKFDLILLKKTLPSKEYEV